MYPVNGWTDKLVSGWGLFMSSGEGIELSILCVCFFFDSCLYFLWLPLMIKRCTHTITCTCRSMHNLLIWAAIHWCTVILLSVLIPVQSFPFSSLLHVITLPTPNHAPCDKHLVFVDLHILLSSVNILI